jgi:hypothetical protein
MDKKDEIILQQLEVIRSMTEHSLKNMSSDIFGRTTLDPESPFYVDPAKKAKTEKPEQKTGKGKPDEKGNVPAGQGAANKKGAETADAAPAEEVEPPEPIEKIKAELDAYVGLRGIKREVNNLISMVMVHNMRKEAGLPVTDLSLHMVFSGNPGTGKSTVARIMARVYHSLGILSKGHLVEVDRAGLVAGYVGQTAIKTAEVIERAKGGLLFIDEAYALSNKSENDFGQEAIDTILKAMEDNREDLVVIVAGYDKLMDDFVHSNPGLESRFNRYLHFDDYTLDEMVAIFELFAKKGYYELAEGTKEAVREFIDESNTNSISFGNGRGVRNIFEHILVCQANRLAEEAGGLAAYDEVSGAAKKKEEEEKKAEGAETRPEGAEAKAEPAEPKKEEPKKLPKLTREQLMLITPADVEQARKDAREGWSPAARKESDRGGSGARDTGKAPEAAPQKSPEEELKELLAELSESVKDVKHDRVEQKEQKAKKKRKGLLSGALDDDEE